MPCPSAPLTSYRITLPLPDAFACFVLNKAAVSNVFYNLLLSEKWEEVAGSDGEEYQSLDTPGVYVLATDLALVWDPEFKAQVYLYAQDNDLFLHEFGMAWTALMNADRFDGPAGSVCD